MAEATNQLKERLQIELDGVKQRLEHARQEIATLEEQDKEDIRKMREEVEHRLAAQEQHAKQVRERIADAVRARSEQTEETVRSWRERRELKHLEKRAARAEETAIDYVVAAMIDADDAEIAVLDALDARLDADMAAANP